MKTKTIDKLIGMINNANSTDKISITMCETLVELEKERKRKEQKSRECGISIDLDYYTGRITELEKENEGLKQDLKHFKDKSDVFARNIKDLISNQEINPMDVNKLYIKDYLFMHDERLFSGCVEYEKGKPIHISKRLLGL